MNVQATLPPLTEAQAKAAIDSCTCFHFRRVSRLLTSMYDHYLSPAGVRSGQLVLLLTIKTAGSATRNRLAEMVDLDQSALSRGLQALERQNLIQSVAGDDRRTRIVTLTDLGEAKILEAVPFWERAQRAAEEAIGADATPRMLAELDRVRERIQPELSKA